ncbi:hypothetical protein B484DRAFT_393397 [Ochromonadaceae sp. CCMP2298]|nr:hypothetical protein B484DRAFT_393397 [Ochromonadaceae sp. CCMP2298]
MFGKDALKIVDYYGAIAAGKSARVVLCEVGGVLCGTYKDAQKFVLEEHLLQQSNLIVLVAHSTKWDAKLREEFGDNFLYGDNMVNLHQAQSIHVEDIDFDKLRGNRQWTEWMRGVFDDAKRHKLLCNRDEK